MAAVGIDSAYAPAAGKRNAAAAELRRCPYYEMALDNAHPVRERVLAELVLLDALFAGGEA
jgi:uncharacterized protein YqcC (DUF446 family)